jgi:general secretion pathway protein I
MSGASSVRSVTRAKPRGFTLLEVLVAIAILGLSLSVILSSQVGLFSSAARTENLSLAVGLARCKMNEVEEKLLRDGYPVDDEEDEGACCGDDVDRDFTCSWKIQTVQLPEQQQFGADGGLNGEGGVPSGDGGLPGALALNTPQAPMQAGDPGTLGALGALASVGQSGGSVLGADGGIDGLSNLMGAASGGVQGMAPLLMGMVYPQLKPMLEASIRKVIITVKWKEGHSDRHLDVTQYVTNPTQGGFNPMAGQQMDQIESQLGAQTGNSTSTSGTP